MADAVNLLGDSADGATATTAISGCIPLDVWNAAGDFTVFVGDEQGAPLFTGAGKGWVDNLNGTITLTDTGNLAVNIPLIYIRIFNITGTGVENWYLITSRDLNTVTFSDISLIGTGTWGASGTADYSIGGIGDIRANTGGSEDLQDQFDDIGNFAADGSNNVDILINRTVNGATTDDYSFLMNSVTGSATQRVRVISVNGSFVDDGTELEINTTSTLANGLMDFPVSGASVYVSFENILFNGGGKDATRAVYCITESGGGAASEPIFWINCTFTGASSHGVNHESDFWDFDNCLFTLNGGSGFAAAGNDGVGNRFNYCDFIDNDGDGLTVGGINNIVTHCIAAGNGGIGFSLSNGSTDGGALRHCTSSGNTGHGFFAASNAVFMTWTDNVSVSNTGDGYFITNAITEQTLFRNNSAYANAQPSNLATTDAAFEILGGGHNITTDPDLNVSFIPSSSSPLIDAGIGGTGDTIGALCATAGGGAGGGVMPLTGLLS